MATAQKVVERIGELADAGHNAAAIVRDLSSVESQAKFGAPPDVTTIRRIIRRRRRSDSSGIWSLLGSDREQVQIIIPALAAIMLNVEDGESPMTRDEADVLELVLRSRPSLDGWSAYRFAKKYLECRESGTSHSVLDAALALEPWASRECAETYMDWWTGSLPRSREDLNCHYFVYYTTSFLLTETPRETSDQRFQRLTRDGLDLPDSEGRRYFDRIPIAAQRISELAESMKSGSSPEDFFAGLRTIQEWTIHPDA